MLSIRSRSAVMVFLLPPLGLYLVAVVGPILYSLVLSLFEWDGLSAMTFVGLDNYRQMLFHDNIFWTAAGHGLVYLGSACSSSVVALMLANLLTYILQAASSSRPCTCCRRSSRPSRSH